MLGEHIDQLRPNNSPTPESIGAARAASSVVNTYLGVVKLEMEYSKRNGQKPQLPFLRADTTK